jgi:hypothetical protein
LFERENKFLISNFSVYTMKVRVTIVERKIFDKWLTCFLK